MEDQPGISARIERARQVEKVLYWVGWLVAAVGVAGMAVFTAFWVAGDLDAEQGVTLVLGTTLATVLSGVTAYGAGVSIGLGAERLRLAAREAENQPAGSGMMSAAKEPGGTPRSGEM